MLKVMVHTWKVVKGKLKPLSDCCVIVAADSVDSSDDDVWFKDGCWVVAGVGYCTGAVVGSRTSDCRLASACNLRSIQNVS